MTTGLHGVKTWSDEELKISETPVNFV